MPTNDVVTALTYVYSWEYAVRMQRHRILTPDVTTEDLVRFTRQHDSFLFAFAVHGPRTAARLFQRIVPQEAEGAVAKAIAKFDEVVPDARRVRDVLAHFDEYATGSGRLQGKLADARLGVWYEYTGTTHRLHVSLAPGAPGLALEVAEAADATNDLAQALSEAISAESWDS